MFSIIWTKMYIIAFENQKKCDHFLHVGAENLDHFCILKKTIYRAFFICNFFQNSRSLKGFGFFRENLKNCNNQI